MYQKCVSNSSLNLFQYFVRYRQFPITAAFLGNLYLTVMPPKVVANGIEGPDRNTQILFKGGNLPIYDHRSPLPQIIIGTIQCCMANGAAVFGCGHMECAAVGTLRVLKYCKQFG